MHKVLFAFLLFMFSLHLNAQVVEVTGIILDSTTQKPLNKTTLLRLSDNKYFFTDSTGTFDITCTSNDAIRISYVGYNTLRLIVKNVPDSTTHIKKYLVINMIRDVKNIPQIIIRDQKPLVIDSVYYNKALKPMETSIMSPISLLYAQFSKKEKEKKKLNEILEAQYMEDVWNYRLPKQKILNITNDRNFTLQQLKNHCYANDFFILNAGDYDLYQWVKACYASWKK
jgi:hypothetical protein